MESLHISQSELMRDLGAILERVERGAEIVVERDQRPVAVIRPVEPEPRTLSELIELATQREKERGCAITMGEDYAADVRQIVQERKPWTPRSWD